jgi:hypothetical protein
MTSKDENRKMLQLSQNFNHNSLSQFQELIRYSWQFFAKNFLKNRENALLEKF